MAAMIYNWPGDVLRLEKCDWGFGRCTTPTDEILVFHNTGGEVDAGPAVTERRPMCARHASAYHWLADEHHLIGAVLPALGDGGKLNP